MLRDLAYPTSSGPCPCPIWKRTIDRPFRYGVSITLGGICPGIRSRFSDGTAFGVWYGSLSIVTTIYETVYHWLRFLDDAGIRDGSAGPVIADRRVFKVRVAGILIDLRGKELEFPNLVSTRGYSFTHRLGDHLNRAGQSGLILMNHSISYIGDLLPRDIWVLSLNVLRYFFRCFTNIFYSLHHGQ